MNSQIKQVSYKFTVSMIMAAVVVIILLPVFSDEAANDKGLLDNAV
jgi:hypothetical protein